MIVVKAHSEAQLQDAFNIRKTVFVEEQKVPLELEIDEFENSSDHFVLYSKDIPIGAGRFRVLNGKGKIERICVLSDERGTGAGNKIMTEIEHYAKKSGIKILKLNAQTYAIPFYEKLGYRVVSEEFLDAGIPHKTMEKNIT
ncbi:GNAT family N-acetyltransferase [Bacillus sp. FJAT-49711]|uniref:GNAT family N-acetyltransferase n=1 Tax=Bacillus sp. FJAT-49711 TaxID=2833585 RepID=UPI001BC95848|nr:GNAT family N-acetyltransferase [Bacillus sp. FJAT-49711]MBS4217986.1 GNAT family N-acetyltransferase [Bacillus sp. FJAT-49711]